MAEEDIFVTIVEYLEQSGFTPQEDLSVLYFANDLRILIERHFRWPGDDEYINESEASESVTLDSEFSSSQ